MVRVQPEGAALRVSVDLRAPLPELYDDLGFSLEIYPGAYIGKSYHIDAAHGMFPEPLHGPRARGAVNDDENTAALLPLATGARFVSAPEDPLRRFEVSRRDRDAGAL